MSDILQHIVAERRKAVESLKKLMPASKWKTMPLFRKECISLEKRLAHGRSTGIIAEFKRASPSKGVLNATADVATVVSAYELHNAAAASILTEPAFFKGSNDDIMAVVDLVNMPLLRKDFIIDEYQVIEAKGIGADAILLIAACLSPAEVKQLARAATDIGLDVLLELHDEEELDHICDETVLIGINNRNLKTFEVDVDRSLRMAENIPGGKIKIAESGIRSAADIDMFRGAGFTGFLVGEHFMKEADPAKAFENFVRSLSPA